MHTGERDGERRASEDVPGHLFVGPVIVDLQRAVAPPPTCIAMHTETVTP